MNDLQNKTTDELIEMGRGLFRGIYVTDCFSASDIINLDLIEKELESRKVKVNYESDLTFETEETTH